MKKKLVKTATTISVLIISIVLCIAGSPRTLSQTLTLTLFTNKNTYNLGEAVTIFGNLTENGQPITDGLIGIQVKTPSGKTLLIRSLQTYPYETRYCPIYVWSVTPCDEWGNPKNAFEQGSNAYFKITLTNFHTETLIPLVTVMLFDTNNIPIGYAGACFEIPEKQTYTLTLWVPIPSDATLGTAAVYASAFTNWPQLNGVPFCPEKSNTLQIIQKSKHLTLAQKMDEASILDTNGSYSMTFKLHPFGEIGTYTIYATSQYNEEKVIETKGFLAGVKGDINEDGSVDSQDLGLLGMAWGSIAGEPTYNPKADLDESGVIDSSDLGIMGMYWGYCS